MRRKLPLAWLQLKREKIRLAVALSGISFAVVLIFMEYGFKASLYDSNIRPHQHLEFRQTASFCMTKWTQVIE